MNTPLTDLENQFCLALVEQCGGDLMKVVEALEETLRRFKKQHGIFSPQASLLNFTSLYELQEAYIWAVFHFCNGDIISTAKRLGVDKRTVRSWIYSRNAPVKYRKHKLNERKARGGGKVGED